MALFSKSLPHPVIDFCSANKRPRRLLGTKIQMNAPPPTGRLFGGGGFYSENSGTTENMSTFNQGPGNRLRVLLQEKGKPSTDREASVRKLSKSEVRL